MYGRDKRRTINKIRNFPDIVYMKIGNNEVRLTQFSAHIPNVHAYNGRCFSKALKPKQAARRGRHITYIIVNSSEHKHFTRTTKRHAVFSIWHSGKEPGNDYARQNGLLWCQYIARASAPSTLVHILAIHIYIYIFQSVGRCTGAWILLSLLAAYTISFVWFNAPEYRIKPILPTLESARQNSGKHLARTKKPSFQFRYTLDKYLTFHLFKFNSTKALPCFKNYIPTNAIVQRHYKSQWLTRSLASSLLTIPWNN